MKRWLKYVKPYWVYFLVGPLCMIVEVLGEIFIPDLFSKMIDGGIMKNSYGFVIMICVLMIVTALLMLAGGVGGSYFGAKASVNFATDLRQDLFNSVQKFSFSNIDKFSTGSLVTRLTNDVTQLQNFVNMLLRMCLRAPGMLIGALIMTIIKSPKISLILAVIIPIMGIVLFFCIKKGFPLFQSMQTKIDKLNSNIQENITNVRVVKSFVREDYEDKKFKASNSDLKKSGLAAMNVMIFIQPVMMFMMYAATIAVMWFGGNDVVVGSMSLGDLTALVNYITQILMSIMMLTMLFVFSSRALASGRRISEVLDEKVDITDDSADKNAVVTKGDVEFKNVSFRYYKNSEEKVLDNINLKIPAGKTVGIIGSTGSGKTTLVSLIPRLYDADEGSVTVDGVDVRDYSIENLRKGVGMVLQKNVLFSGTIAENLRWGDGEATDEEMEEAAKSAQADAFVKSFPDGYNTVLDQGGTNVSGGQKQRLCIARALLKKPKIIILDDSTSAVDTATEANIRKAFTNELSDSTKIIIAQRISSVKDSDMIVVLDDGKITGVGTHDELLANNSEYQEIYYSQNDRKEDK